MDPQDDVNLIATLGTLFVVVLGGLATGVVLVLFALALVFLS